MMCPLFFFLPRKERLITTNPCWLKDDVSGRFVPPTKARPCWHCSVVISVDKTPVSNSVSLTRIFQRVVNDSVARRLIPGATTQVCVVTNNLDQGWPNFLNARATYDKLQMFESRKTLTDITHTFLLLHAHFVTKILKYIYLLYEL
jgi:hypothetical protein